MPGERRWLRCALLSAPYVCVSAGRNGTAGFSAQDTSIARPFATVAGMRFVSDSDSVDLHWDPQCKGPTRLCHARARGSG
jgi:hypothetical protein